MTKNLKPCPFCGREQATLEYQVKLTPTGPFQAGVFCRYCGGAVIRTEITDAIYAWNTRQSEAVDQPQSNIDWEQRKYEVAKDLLSTALNNSNASGIDVKQTLIPSVISTSEDLIAQLKER